MNTRSFLLLIMLVSAISVAGQEKTGKDGELSVVAPERKELAERQYKVLQKGNFAQLKIEPMPLELIEIEKKATVRYQAGGKVKFQLLITNMIEPVVIPISDTYIFNRPELVRGGQLVPYREDINKLVQAKDKSPTYVSIRLVTLEPNETFSEIINLSDWYEPLEAGRYQLIMRRRFIEGGEWVESTGIMFEVDPE